MFFSLGVFAKVSSLLTKPATQDFVVYALGAKKSWKGVEGVHMVPTGKFSHGALSKGRALVYYFKSKDM